jgi:hypothetical protein
MKLPDEPYGDWGTFWDNRCEGSAQFFAIARLLRHVVLMNRLGRSLYVNVTLNDGGGSYMWTPEPSNYIPRNVCVGFEWLHPHHWQLEQHIGPNLGSYVFVSRVGNNRGRWNTRMLQRLRSHMRVFHIGHKQASWSDFKPAKELPPDIARLMTHDWNGVDEFPYQEESEDKYAMRYCQRCGNDIIKQIWAHDRQRFEKNQSETRLEGQDDREQR